ncbi:hypothetical protein [Microbacterium sp. CFBP9034]|uniref:hypothetical protein n=1 Tax=Microbacterium sp. CFBP9034 TaxID=3096540 RepID=UPI002A69DD0F|nr:hypothetical protein [Microbacterium sp. CFBP9034]MDY0908810.1 hypothetical protein [Microbacterium sp. CFBP9034]
MSTTLTTGANPAPDQDPDRPRSKTARRVWLSVLVLAIIGFLLGALVLFAWMVNETHFDRPSQEFDEFEAEVASLPGVESVEKERWVEAPTFWSPTSWIFVTVDEAGLPGLLDAGCSPSYADPVTWSIRVRTQSAAEVSLHAGPTAPAAAGAQEQCPDFGFDAVRLVDELDIVAPGLALQPSVWDNGRFALVALEDEVQAGFTHLLPLIAHADDLLVAAGLDSKKELEINAANLGLVLEPGESDEYLALLTELAEDHAVSSYWADGGGTPIDGVEKVQIVAPDQQREAIEEAIRSSGLHIADRPVRFLEQ